MRVTMIIGEPSSGKSTLVRNILGFLGVGPVERIPYVSWHITSTSGRILGDYSDPSQKYPGTDRLSMACQPHVLKLIEKWRDSGAVSSVLFEGDRLGNGKMIDALMAMPHIDFKLMLCDAGAKLDDRQSARLDQSNTFKMSRRTKIANLVKRYNPRVISTGYPWYTAANVRMLIGERL